MMKIAVFGASGRTGIPLLQQALAQGYEVVALVRNPAKLTLKHANLTVIQGDAMNAQDVERTIEGTQAVISALGHTKGTPNDMQTIATQHIIVAMKKHHLKRFISLTGAGVSAPQDQPKFVNHIIKFALQVLSAKVLKDAEQHAQVIANSDLDWTIVRGPMLTEGAHTGKYRVGWVGVNTSAKISRADLAEFMLKQLNDNTFYKQMPMVSE
jgi:putative NADH-flavin reductase